MPPQESQDILERVKRIETRASFAKTQKDFDSALTHLDEGIALLRTELKLNSGNAELSEFALNRRNEIADRLADFCGQKGGILRRQGRLPDAAKSYREGALIEQKPEYHIEKSYNLTNQFVLDALVDCDSVSRNQGAISEAIEIVARQVDNRRRDSCWAWADYAILLVLAGRRVKAREAYERLLRTELETWALESTLEVLGQLAITCGAELSVREGGEGLIADEMVEFLRKSKASPS